MLFYIMIAFLKCLLIIMLLGDFFQVGKFICVSFVLSNDIWVVSS